MKAATGIGVGFALGFVCHWAGIPSPAPPVVAGALLVVAMTLGYAGTDRWLCRRTSGTTPTLAAPTGAATPDPKSRAPRPPLLSA